MKPILGVLAGLLGAVVLFVQLTGFSQLPASTGAESIGAWLAWILITVLAVSGLLYAFGLKIRRPSKSRESS